MFGRVAAAGMLWALCCAAGSPADFDAAKAFGARELLQDVSLSPDGKRIAYLAATGGMQTTLYMIDVGEDAKPTAVLVSNGDPERLTDCHWASNDRLACSIYGVSRDSMDLLPFTRMVAVDAKGGNVKLLSRRTNSDTYGFYLRGGEVIDWLPDQDGMVLMTRMKLPDDRPGSHLGSAEEGLMVDRVDTRTLASTTVEQPKLHAVEYISDGHGNVRIMGENLYKAETQETGVTRYWYRKQGSRDWQRLGDFDYMSRDGFNPYAIDHERNAAYGFRKTDGRQALYRVALDGTGREELLFDRPDVDVDGLIRLGRSRRVIGVSYADDTRQAVYFDQDIDRLATSLCKALPKQPNVRIVDASADEKTLLIWAGSDDDPGVYYVLDRATRHMAIWRTVRPQLEGQTLAEMKPIRYRAADGTMVPAYLTLPPGGSAKGLPAIVLPHGGPGSRDEWGFDWLVQFYAAKGYAVLQPQFRGSAGYGDAWFQKNGFQSWRLAIGDVLDAGRWLVAEGIAAPSRLAVVGWSYGGYAALQSAVVDAGLFKAVVAIAPVSDLAALKQDSRYWSDFTITKDFIGTGPHIREGSPAQNAERIKAPVLLFHGEMDRNVKIS